MNTLPILLPSWFPRVPINFALILLLMTGCAQQVKPVQEQPTKERPDDPYARSDLDELLDFGASLDGKTSSAQSEVCRALVKRQKEAPSVGVLLHLMTGRLFSDACGDIPKIMDDVDAIPLDGLSDGRVRGLVSLEKEALKHIHRLSKKIATLRRKQKSLQSSVGSKGSKNPRTTGGAMPSTDGEASKLREKLEHIRDMEQRLDEPGDGN